MRFLQSRTEFCSAYDKNYFIIGLQLSATHILFSEGEWEGHNVFYKIPVGKKQCDLTERKQ